MPESFTHDVFLSHSSKDKHIVRDIANRLKADGLMVWFDEWEIKPGDSIPAKIEEGLENSRLLVFCMSRHAFGSDWTQLESGTFRFRDPLNRQRRFLPLRLDDSPIKGSLRQFLYINWLPAAYDYDKLLESCRNKKVSLKDATFGAEADCDPIRASILDEMEDISFGCCIERWQAAGVSKKFALQLAKDKSVGEPTEEMCPSSEHSLRVLVGEVGSGKTLYAHRLFQRVISQARMSSDAPWPIFVNAREVVGRLKDKIGEVLDGLDYAPVKQSAVFLVIDGADEAGHVAINNLLSEARILTASQRPSIQIVITSRPFVGMHEKTIEEIVDVPLLSESTSWSLIGSLSGHEGNGRMISNWPKSLQDTVRRPLFAILFGVFLKSHTWKKSFSIGEVLSHLVERAIENTNLQKANAHQLLEKLASLSTERGGGFVPLSALGLRRDVEPLLESRLIVERNGAVKFPLEIFREWFGAQALVSNEKLLIKILDDLLALDAWLNAFIIAVAILDHENASKILIPLIKKHPGMASVVVDRALAKWGTHDEEHPPPLLECGQHIRWAMQSWVSGIGPLARLIAPVRDDGEVRQIGVSMNKSFLAASWCQGTESVPDVVLLPPLKNQKMSRDWPGVRMAQFGRQSGWAWRWTLEELAGRLKEIVGKKMLLSRKGPLMDEILWPQLMAIKRQGVSLEDWRYESSKQVIQISDVEQKLASYETTNVLFASGVRCNLDFVREQLAYARSCGIKTFASPLPESDQNFRGGLVGSNFSDERLLERATIVYAKAVESYQQIIEDWFMPIASRLARYVLMPLQVVGIIIPYDEANQRSPLLRWYLEPLPVGSKSIVSFEINYSPGVPDFPDFFRKQNDIISALRPGAKNWIAASWSDGFLDIFDSRPIAKIVYEWLEEDLKAIAWLS